MRAILIISSVLLFFSGAWGQKFMLTPEKEQAQIGEPIEVKLSFTYPTSIGDVDWPEFYEDSTVGGNYEIWGFDTLKKQSSTDGNTSEITITQNLTVATFTSGYIPFEPLFVVADNDTIESNAFLIAIDTVMVDTTEAINDIKPIMTDPLSGWEQFTIWLGKNWWWVTIVIIGIGVVLFFLLRKKKEKPVIVPHIPLHQQYLDRYHKLMAAQLWKKGQVKEHYLELTNLLRSYYLDRYGISTFEKTTQEIISLSSSITEDKSILIPVIEVFRKSEFVKFAKQIPGEFEIESHNKSVLEFFEKTQVKEEEKEVNS